MKKIVTTLSVVLICLVFTDVLAQDNDKLGIYSTRQDGKNNIVRSYVTSENIQIFDANNAPSAQPEKLKCYDISYCLALGYTNSDSKFAIGGIWD